jgi:putative endonuclease
LALDHLKAKGLKELGRNFSCRGGEIDLVMMDGKTLVFVEVRFRQPSTFATAAESVDRHKQKRLVHCALAYLARHSVHANSTIRFDVIAVNGQPDGQCAIQWIKDAFRP